MFNKIKSWVWNKFRKPQLKSAIDFKLTGPLYTKEECERFKEEIIPFSEEYRLEELQHGKHKNAKKHAILRRQRGILKQLLIDNWNSHETTNKSLRKIWQELLGPLWATTPLDLFMVHELQPPSDLQNLYYFPCNGVLRSVKQLTIIEPLLFKNGKPCAFCDVLQIRIPNKNSIYVQEIECVALVDIKRFSCERNTTTATMLIEESNLKIKGDMMVCDILRNEELLALNNFAKSSFDEKLGQFRRWRGCEEAKCEQVRKFFAKHSPDIQIKQWNRVLMVLDPTTYRWRPNLGCSVDIIIGAIQNTLKASEYEALIDAFDYGVITTNISTFDDDLLQFEKHFGMNKQTRILLECKKEKVQSRKGNDASTFSHTLPIFIKNPSAFRKTEMFRCYDAWCEMVWKKNIWRKLVNEAEYNLIK